ncbi:PREDICTED: zinc finger protein ubi-d4-like isoform X1 [Polistes canadensis]|uniref:zinc finger protein ubi-d4-like isoform X1 n=1 Tax=Polistes canadensis TaxID=91411 RepID=UPI000718D80C|nr:PREDICTED: zinc finger protein ubi-d4-like isoform X1 [Polistes canadensis]
MTAVAMSPASHGIIQAVNENNLIKIESFLNDTAYREAIENSSNYNSRLCRERRLRMPFLDSQTGVAQNHSTLFMSPRERLPGLLHGQIYTYPSKRWRKKRRQYLMHYLHPKRMMRGDIEDGSEGIETITHVNDDSKESVGLKDEHSKDAWYYDEQDMLDMDAYEEPDPDSDYDYEESYSSKRKRRKHRGGGHHPARSHPPTTDSPGTKRTKGGGRGRKKTNYDAVDSDKPFVCDLCSARYKTRPGLVYHYGHSHSTSSGDPAKELSPSPAEVEPRSVADTAASNQPGHPTCLQFTANMIVSVRKYRWQCIECKCCSICGTSDNDDQLLFCDDCDRGYHMYCLSPPLASPPEGSWSCRLCIAEFHRRD